MENILNETNLNNSLTANYMPRPRIEKIFDGAAHCKLIYVVAGAGYGKTRAVHQYIEQQPDAVIRWVQLTEGDNVGSRYWDSLTHNISFDNADLANRLREFGFPQTLARFNQFIEILKNVEYRSYKTYFVLDDFHNIYSEQMLTFAQRCAYTNIPGLCTVVISRKEPEINAVSLFSKGRAIIIGENDLRFTDNEIRDFLRLCDIPFSLKDIPKFAAATGGWAIAVKLLSLVLKRMPGNLGLAFDIMKQNIFKLLETEAWDGFPENVQKAMLQLSLISNPSLVPLDKIFEDVSFLQNTPELASFVWFDSFIGDYRLHPLYLEFLQSKQHTLSDWEKQDIYLRAAKWCYDNNFHMDAVNYYTKLRQYERILDYFRTYPFKLPIDKCEYFISLISPAEPSGENRSDEALLKLKQLIIPVLLVGAGRYGEAREMSLAVIREWENRDGPLAWVFLYISYNNLAYINMYTCTVTHRYDSSEHIKKAVEYYKRSPVLPIQSKDGYIVGEIRSFVCTVGEGAGLREFDQYLENIKKIAFYAAQTAIGTYCGYDELAACEIAFYKNQMELAKHHAHNAILTAREKKQYLIESVAEQYLLRIASQEGNYPLVKEILKRLRIHLNNPDFWCRQLFYDIYTGYFYAKIGLPEMVPPWLAADEKAETSEIRIPTRELIINVTYHIACKNFNQALIVLAASYPREPQERFLFGELTLTLLFAVAKVKTGDAPGAVSAFEKAYKMSFDGVFEMFFIGLGKNLHPLVVAASSEPGCYIPGEWLKMIDRKASIYAKKANIILNSVKKEKNIKDAVSLSDREHEVLNDLYHGLSRDEIAENRYLSVNTVKKILQSIYIKLNANNNVDTIRIAIEKKLVG